MEITPRRRRSHKPLIIVIILLLCIAITTLLLVFFAPKPGVATYDLSLTTEEQAFVQSILEADGIKLKNDVTITATDELTTPTDTNALLYDVLVPTADFYYAASNITSTALDSNAAVQLTPINNLTPTRKLLSLDGNYYLDTFDSGAFFRTLHFDSEDPSEAIALIQPHLAALPTKNVTLSLAQTGVTALSRAMNAKLATVSDATYFATNIADFLSSKDLTHTSNESSSSNSATANNICSKPAMIDALTAIGLDIVELTGNHNQDCGNDDAISTIDTYHSLGIQTYGGGKTATEAAIPLQIDQKSTRITMLGYNLSTGGYTLGNTPGANFYTEERAAADITAAKERGDFIIVDIQYYECNNYDVSYEDATCDAPISGQRELFRHIIDLGADIVVGTSAHQAQTYELYNNGAIYYGLGNLFFDQIWWPGTTRSLILTHYFIDGKHIQTRITPTVYDQSMQTKLLDEETSTWLLDRLATSR